MAKFVFGLQGYFNLKTKLEDQKRLEYGEAVARLERERALLDKMMRERRDCVLRMKESINEKVDSLRLQSYNVYAEALSKRMTEQNEVIERAAESAEIKRVELVKAMQDRKTLETLREKHYNEYFIEENRKEQKVTDELVSYRHNR